MQRIEIIGNVGSDAVVKDLQNNQVINFSVAVSEKYNGEAKTTWFEISKFGNNVSVAPYIKKGGKIFISGKPNNRAWLNNAGEAQVTNGILAFDIELLGGYDNSAQENNNSQNPENESDGLPF